MAQKINKKGAVVFAKRADHTNGSVLVGTHEIVGKQSGKRHVCLDFEDGSSVIYPNNWTPNFDIVIGNKYAAGWVEGKFRISQC